MYDDAYESTDHAHDAPANDRSTIDDESRAQADGATVPYPASPRDTGRATHPRPATYDPLGNLTGRTPW